MELSREIKPCDYLACVTLSCVSVRYLCSQVRVLAQAGEETADVGPRQQALHQSWTGCDLLQQ